MFRQHNRYEAIKTLSGATMKNIYFIPVWLDGFFKATKQFGAAAPVDISNAIENLSEDDKTLLYRANVVFMEHLFPELILNVSKTDPRGVITSPWAKFDVSTIKLNLGKCIITPNFEDIDGVDTKELVKSYLDNSIVTVESIQGHSYVTITAQDVKKHKDKLVHQGAGNLYGSILCNLSTVSNNLSEVLQSTLVERYLSSEVDVVPTE